MDFNPFNQNCVRRHRQERHPFLDQCLRQVPPGQLLKRCNHLVFKALFLEICRVPSEMEQKEPTETLAPGARCAIGDFRKGFENGTCSTTSIMLMTSHFPQASNHREPCNAPRCQRFSVVRHCPRVDQAQWGKAKFTRRHQQYSIAKPYGQPLTALDVAAHVFNPVRRDRPQDLNIVSNLLLVACSCRDQSGCLIGKKPLVNS